jgi:hypothetical protein
VRAHRLGGGDVAGQSRGRVRGVCHRVVLVSVFSVVGVSRRSPSIGQWAGLATDLVALAVIGIGLRIYHREPT